MNAQQEQALKRANEVRLRECAFRRRISALSYDEGCEIIAALLDDSDLPAYIGSMKVDRVITAVHRMGSRRAADVRRDASLMRREVRIRDLTVHEKRRLAQALRRRSRRVNVDPL